jgi:FKBP-type peptidyl-prolyl cis-trans isomerase SlyD
VRIDAGTVVTLEYELRNADGEPLEEDDARLAYLHGGFGGIFPKVEAALEGKAAGHELDITLEPKDAFGEYDADLLRVEPRNLFPGTLDVGMQFEGVPGEGGGGEATRIYTVTDIADDKVVVDANHPYAGERLWFKCVVREVRRASPEEIAAGHAREDSPLEALRPQE